MFAGNLSFLVEKTDSSLHDSITTNRFLKKHNNMPTYLVMSFIKSLVHNVRTVHNISKDAI